MTAVDIDMEPGQIQQAPPRLTLAQKIVEIALAVDHIDKDKTFPGQGKWTYASAENVLSTVRGEFLKHGVLVLGSERESSDRPRTTARGDETMVTTVHLTFTLLDAETDERIELAWLGRGEDAADRGVGKALTNAIKTFMRQQLMLPWGDDIEADDSDGSASHPRASGDTVDLLSLARGLSNAQLNEALVAGGLPAQQGNPFATFMRIPVANAVAVEAHLAKLTTG